MQIKNIQNNELKINLRSSNETFRKQSKDEEQYLAIFGRLNLI